MKRLLSIFVVLLGLMVAAESYANAPKLITFQAQLIDSRTNVPLNGNVPISFEIYETETGGSALWVEHNNVSAENGFINVYLGGKTAFPSYMKFDKQYYVQITVDGKTYPRTPLTSVPYSMFSTTADTADFAFVAATVVDGAITQSKLAPGVQAIPWGAAGGVLSGTYPNPQLNVANVRTALKGAITQDMFSDDLQLIPGGPAGGDLIGTYPNPQLGERVVKTWNIAEYAVTTQKIDDYAVTNIKIAPNAVTSDKIATGAVGDDELDATGVNAGTYGDKWNIPTFTVNEDGRLTAASEVRVIPFADSYDGNEIAFNIAHTGANDALALLASKTNGRAAEITSESSYPAGWVMGLDPLDEVDATLVVRNTSTDSDKPAIKTYGDIIVNSSIFASNLYATDMVVVGTGTNIVTITPPVNEGDPLEFNGDVQVNGNLFVTDTIFGTVNGQMVGKLTNGAGMTTFNYDGSADATVGIAPMGVTNAMLENSSLTVTAGAGLTGGGVVALGSSVELALPEVGTAGTYGSNVQVPVITTDAYGRVTAVNTTAISFPAEIDPFFTASPAAGITATNITNWNNVYANAAYTTSTYNDPAWLTGLHWNKLTNVPATFPPAAHTHAWTEITATPTTVAGYGITDAMTTAHPANAITATNITNWNNVYTNAVYSNLTYNDPTWLTGLHWNKLTNVPATFPPAAHTHAWAEITATPTTVAGYGITDAMTTAHDANAITAADIANWDEAYSWGDHALEGYLTALNIDATLTGDGTVATPLGLNLANPNTWTATQTINGDNDDTTPMLVVNNTNVNYAGILIKAQVSANNSGTAAIFSSNNTNPLDATVTIEQSGTGDALYAVGNVTVDGDLTVNQTTNLNNTVYISSADDINMLEINNSSATFAGTLLRSQITVPNSGQAAIFSTNNTNALDYTVMIEQTGLGDALYTIGNIYTDGNISATGDVNVDGNITAIGDITANSFTGTVNVSNLTNGAANNVLLTNAAGDATLWGSLTAANMTAGDYSSVVNAGTYGINITGNAATVTNGVYTTGSYADPAWITSLASSKVTNGAANNVLLTNAAGDATVWGSLTAANMTAGDYSSVVNAGTYGINITGNAGTVTNGVYTTGAYADPAWITSLDFAKVTNLNINATLTGNGSVATPYGLNLNNSNTWTARQNINANDPNYALFVTNSNANGTSAYFESNSNFETMIIQQNGAGDALFVSGNSTFGESSTATNVSILNDGTMPALAVTGATGDVAVDVLGDINLAGRFISNTTTLPIMNLTADGAFNNIIVNANNQAAGGIAGKFLNSNVANVANPALLAEGAIAFRAEGDVVINGDVSGTNNLLTTSLSLDPSLTGNGTVATPLAVDMNNVNTWLADQNFTVLNVDTELKVTGDVVFGNNTAATTVQMQNNATAPVLTVIGGDRLNNIPAIDILGDVNFEDSELKLNDSRMFVSSSTINEAFITLTNTNPGFPDYMLNALNQGGGSAGYFGNQPGNALPALVAVGDLAFATEGNANIDGDLNVTGSITGDLAYTNLTKPTLLADAGKVIMVNPLGDGFLLGSVASTLQDIYDNSNLENYEISTTGKAPITFSSTDATNVLVLNTEQPAAFALQVKGSVNIQDETTNSADNQDPLFAVTYTNNTNATEDAISGYANTFGAAGAFYNDNATRQAPTLFVESKSDGSSLVPRYAGSKGAAIHAVNTVVGGQAILAEGKVDITGATRIDVDANGEQVLISKSGDGGTAFQVNTNVNDAVSAKLIGSVIIEDNDGGTDNTDPLLQVNYVNNTTADVDAISATHDGQGAAAYFIQNNANNTSAPALFAESWTDGSNHAGAPYRFDAKGAAIYANNAIASNTSTALYIEKGKTVLAYLSVPDQATLAISGYATVIFYTALAGDNPEIGDLPNGAENGQILYITFENAQTFDPLGLNVAVPAGRTLTFVYAGNAWRLLN